MSMDYTELFEKLEEEFDFITANEIRMNSGRELREGLISLEEWTVINDRVSLLRSDYRKNEDHESLPVGTPVSIGLGGVPGDPAIKDYDQP